MPAGLRIDPNAPTKEEIIAHNTRVAKCNLACNLAEKLCENAGFAVQISAMDLAKYAINIAETIIGNYPITAPPSPVQGERPN